MINTTYYFQLIEVKREGGSAQAQSRCPKSKVNGVCFVANRASPEKGIKRFARGKRLKGKKQSSHPYKIPLFLPLSKVDIYLCPSACISGFKILVSFFALLCVLCAFAVQYFFCLFFLLGEHEVRPYKDICANQRNLRIRMLWARTVSQRIDFLRCVEWLC